MAHDNKGRDFQSLPLLSCGYQHTKPNLQSKDRDAHKRFPLLTLIIDHLCLRRNQNLYKVFNF